ncbi:MAG TPA: hypothetical protein VGI60_04060 [Chthoniobacterales bacterium]|jgi:hypothetical protein
MSLNALRRKSVRIANSRWTTYAVAGAATSLAGLAPAEAEIHYSGQVNFIFKGTLNHPFPLVDGAVLNVEHIDFGGGRGLAHAAIDVGSNDVGIFAGDSQNITSNTPFYLYRLASHVKVSQERLGESCIAFSTSSTTVVRCFGGYIGEASYPGVHFKEPGRGFIGFRFNTGAGDQYGWLRVKTSGEAEYNFIVVDYAWGDPGDTIKTGQKTSADTANAVTKSGSLGLLATGGAGLKAWRQQTKVAASH